MSEKEESFEKALERLARIAAKLEAGDVPLEKGVALYKEGMGLVTSCRKRLDAARWRFPWPGRTVPCVLSMPRPPMRPRRKTVDG